MVLPSGTVTFLFSNVEGSTQLLERHPRAMGEAVRELANAARIEQVGL